VRSLGLKNKNTIMGNTTKSVEKQVEKIDKIIAFIHKYKKRSMHDYFRIIRLSMVRHRLLNNGEKVRLKK